MANINVLHGPNLNMLGDREPEIYGTVTLHELNALLEEQAQAQGHRLKIIQSNSEAELIGWVQQASAENCKFMIINAAALTHTSIGLRDALKMTEIPFIEVHLSNIYGRESFRQHSYLSDIARGMITGLGVDGYVYALQFAMKQI